MTSLGNSNLNEIKNVSSFNANGFSAHLSDGYGQHDSFYWIAIGY